MIVAVVGLGKIGLPIAVQSAGAENISRVLGVDLRADVVTLVNQAQVPFPLEKDLATRLADVVMSGSLTATTSHSEAVRRADYVIVTVPLLVDASGEPDFTSLDDATLAVGASLARGTTVIYETTLPVGATRNRLRGLLEERSGMREGVDFWLAYSPERVSSGRVFADLRSYPKLVGALGHEGARRAGAFYQAVLQFDDRPDLDRPNGVWEMDNAETAELTKLAESIYRDVNIALANHFAKFAIGHGVDMADVIAAANSQPYSHIHQPGVAVGGHCIPVYPWLYLSRDPTADLIRVAREVNDGMPGYVVELLEETFDGRLDGARVAVLGATYRGGVKETKFSGVFSVVRELSMRGASAVVHDPLLDDRELEALGFDIYRLGEPVDACIIQADHAEYRTLGADDIPGVRVMVDGRAITEPHRWQGVVRRVIGKPWA